MVVMIISDMIILVIMIVVLLFGLVGEVGVFIFVYIFKIFIKFLVKKKFLYYKNDNYLILK